MSCALKLEHCDRSPLDTILSGETIIPLACDQCFAETEITIRQLIAGQQITCRCCSSVRTLLPIEVNIAHQLLRRHGYHTRT